MADGYPTWRCLRELEELTYSPTSLRALNDCYVSCLTDQTGRIVWIAINKRKLYLAGEREIWCWEFGKVKNHCYLPQRYICRYEPGKEDLTRFESHHLDQPRPHANGRNGEHVFREDGLDIRGFNLYIFVMVCSEYISSACYSLDRRHFGHYSKVISDAKRRLQYGKCTVASDDIPTRGR
jgi:hypothetical protein